MDYTPLIIALIGAPILYYFVTKNIDESKYAEKEPYKPFKWMSDKQAGITIKIVKTLVPVCVFLSLIGWYFNTGRTSASTYRTILLSLIALMQLYLIWFIWTDKKK